MKKIGMILLLTSVFLASCNQELDKERFSDSINQVIELENQELFQMEETNTEQFLVREEIAIAVQPVSEGTYIELYYTLNNETQSSIYKLRNNDYKKMLREEIIADMDSGELDSNLDPSEIYLENTYHK